MDLHELKTVEPGLAAELASFEGVDHVIDWMQRRGRPAHDFVKHDEFYYDFLVELEPAGRWLVFGVNWAP